MDRVNKVRCEVLTKHHNQGDLINLLILSLITKVGEDYKLIPYTI